MPLCRPCCANTQDSPPPSISNTEWEATMFAVLNLLTRDCCCYVLSGEDLSSDANKAALSHPKLALATARRRVTSPLLAPPFEPKHRPRCLPRPAYMGGRPRHIRLADPKLPWH